MTAYHPAVDTPLPSPSPWSRLLPSRAMQVRALINQAACAVVAVVLWQLNIDRSLADSLVFSLIIGNCCWLLIDGGREVAGRWRHARTGVTHPEWPGWGWMVPIIVVGTFVGYTTGHALARRALGLPAASSLVHGPVLAFSVVIALTVSYLFYAGRRVASQKLEAEAARRAASELQLKLLQSQLEPHMLFNTLANLRVLIGLDAAAAQGMLDHLIAFLRSTLVSTRLESHALAAEFDHLRDYLALMAVRMGARLQSRFDLPADLATVPVPPLLLQPLVENAIRHGLEPQVEGGRIEVSAWRDGTQLCLRVRDTGVGPSASAATAGTGFGLDQVRQRLHTLHGSAASLTLRPADDAEGGTEVTVTLPIPP